MTQVFLAIVSLIVIFGSCGIFYLIQGQFDNCYFWMPNKIYHRSSGCKLVKLLKTIPMFLIYLIICCGPIALFIIFFIAYSLYLLVAWLIGKTKRIDNNEEVDAGTRLLKRGMKEAFDIPYDEYECSDLMEELNTIGGVDGHFGFKFNKQAYINKYGQEAYDMWIARKEKDPLGVSEEVKNNDND